MLRIRGRGSFEGSAFLGMGGEEAVNRPRPGQRCLCCPRSFAQNVKIVNVCPWTQRIVQWPRLYMGDIITAPEQAHSSEKLHCFPGGLVDSSPGNLSKDHFTKSSFISRLFRLAPRAGKRPLHTHLGLGRLAVRASCSGLQEAWDLEDSAVVERSRHPHFGVSSIVPVSSLRSGEGRRFVSLW
jgi:hypothetical protein